MIKLSPLCIIITTNVTPRRFSIFDTRELFTCTFRLSTIAVVQRLTVKSLHSFEITRSLIQKDISLEWNNRSLSQLFSHNHNIATYTWHEKDSIMLLPNSTVVRAGRPHERLGGHDAFRYEGLDDDNTALPCTQRRAK